VLKNTIKLYWDATAVITSPTICHNDDDDDDNNNNIFTFPLIYKNTGDEQRGMWAPAVHNDRLKN